jgi:multiple sugar transport system permease protein
MRLNTLRRFTFILPTVALVFAFAVYPAVQTIRLSLLTPAGDFAGIANYLDVLGDRRVVNEAGIAAGRFPMGSLVHTFIWIVIHLPVTAFLGLVLATLLQKVRGRDFIKSVVFLGMVIPGAVGGLVIRFMFEKDLGIVNQALLVFGVPARTWTAYPDTALFALIFGSVWLWTGFSLILYSSGLGTIPRDYFDAARVDGANDIQVFFKITVPLLRPITVVVVVMTIIWELKLFDLVYAATAGGPGRATSVLALEIWYLAFVRGNFNQAAVLAVLLGVIALAVSIPLLRRQR